MARRIVTVSGRYRGERFQTTITDPRLVSTVAWAQFPQWWVLGMAQVGEVFKGFASAMGRAANEVRVFAEYAKLPKGEGWS